jgi:hypothetical protein
VAANVRAQGFSGDRTLAKRRTYMYVKRPEVLRLALAAVVVMISSCNATMALAPGADRVKLTQIASDVAGCKAVGNVSWVPDRDDPRFVETLLRNRTVGLNGNTVFLTTRIEGVAYRCP